MITKYPIGLIARTQYFRVLKSIWNQEVKDFVISRMKASSNNIKPVIILDENTKTTECYFPNQDLTDFELKTGLEADIFNRKVESVAGWMINKANIQKSNLTILEKEKAVNIIEKRDLHKKSLTGLEKAKLASLFSRANIPDA